tara:strand:- start:989 stop:1210 length:222 start_codon:yes stop_codon:yes gene_type:complete
MLTIPDKWKTSLRKYPIIANIKRRVDSPIAECEINLHFLSNHVGMTPERVPTKIELKHNYKKNHTVPKKNPTV